MDDKLYLLGRARALGRARRSRRVRGSAARAGAKRLVCNNLVSHVLLDFGAIKQDQECPSERLLCFFQARHAHAPAPASASARAPTALGVLAALARRGLRAAYGGKDETCPLSTGGRTRRVQFVLGAGGGSAPERRAARPAAGARVPPLRHRVRRRLPRGRRPRFASCARSALRPKHPRPKLLRLKHARPARRGPGAPVTGCAARQGCGRRTCTPSRRSCSSRCASSARTCPPPSGWTSTVRSTAHQWPQCLQTAPVSVNGFSVERSELLAARSGAGARDAAGAQAAGTTRASRS